MMKQDVKGLEQAKKRDPQLFEDIYREHSQEVYTYLVNKTGNIRPLIEELFNETFYFALLYAPSLKSTKFLNTWLKQIAKQRIQARLKEQKDTEELIPFSQQDNQGLHNFDEDREKNKQAILVSTALRKLSGENIKILSDHYNNNKSIRQISILYKKTPAAVEKSLNKAIKSLKSQLTKQTRISVTKEEREWSDSLDDQTLHILFKHTEKLYKIPEKLYNDVLKTIRTSKSLKFPDTTGLIPQVRSPFLTSQLIYFGLITAVVIGIVVGISIFNYYKKEKMTTMNTCIAYSTQGKALIINKNEKRNVTPGTRIIESSRVITLGESSVEAVIGGMDIVSIKGNSEVVFSSLFKSKKTTRTIIDQESGEINYSIQNNPGRSMFKINTHLLSIEVVGTTFTIKSNFREGTKLEVTRGSVSVTYNYQALEMTRLKNTYPEMHLKLSKLLSQPIRVSNGQNFSITLEELQSLTDDVNKLVNELEERIKEEHLATTKIHDKELSEWLQSIYIIKKAFDLERLYKK